MKWYFKEAVVCELWSKFFGSSCFLYTYHTELLFPFYLIHLASGPAFWTRQVWIVLFLSLYYIISFSLNSNLARFGECGGWGMTAILFLTRNTYGEISLHFTVSHRCYWTFVYKCWYPCLCEMNSRYRSLPMSRSVINSKQALHIWILKITRMGTFGSIFPLRTQVLTCLSYCSNFFWFAVELDLHFLFFRGCHYF
jgi:hypothetical protein